MQRAHFCMSAHGQILLKKSKVAGRGIFRENRTRELIADSYSLSRVTEVACEFRVGLRPASRLLRLLRQRARPLATGPGPLHCRGYARLRSW
jgi:hypothetical protein